MPDSGGTMSVNWSEYDMYCDTGPEQTGSAAGSAMLRNG